MHQLHTSQLWLRGGLLMLHVLLNGRYVGYAKRIATYLTFVRYCGKGGCNSCQRRKKAGQLRQAAVSRLTQGRPDY